MPLPFAVYVSFSTIYVTDDATIDTISVALYNFTLSLSFVVFNGFIFVVEVIVIVDNSFPIAVTVTVVAINVDVALAIIVVDVVLFCVGDEVGFDFFISLDVTIDMVTFAVVVP